MISDGKINNLVKIKIIELELLLGHFDNMIINKGYNISTKNGVNYTLSYSDNLKDLFENCEFYNFYINEKSDNSIKITILPNSDSNNPTFSYFCDIPGFMNLPTNSRYAIYILSEIKEYWDYLNIIVIKDINNIACKYTDMFDKYITKTREDS